MQLQAHTPTLSKMSARQGQPLQFALFLIFYLQIEIEVPLNRNCIEDFLFNPLPPPTQIFRQMVKFSNTPKISMLRSSIIYLYLLKRLGG